MMRGWRACAAAVLALALAMGLAGCGKAGGPTEAARDFFALIAEGRAGDAYASAAFAFKAAQTPDFFAVSLREAGLEAIKASKLGTPTLGDDGRSAHLEAELTTKSGAVVRQVVSLTQEDGAWRVLSVKSPRDPRTGLVENRFTFIGRDPGFGDPTESGPVPDLAAARNLARDTLLLFNDAVQRKDFLQLFDEASLHWQDEIVTRQGPAPIPGTMKRELTLTERKLGAARLQHAFQSFVDEQVDLSAIRDMDPVFERPPWINTSGLLMLSGTFPTKPVPVVFALKFYYEVPAWRLYGLAVRMQTAPAQ